MAIYFIFPVQIPFLLGDVSSSQIGLALSLQAFSSVIVALQYQRLRARYSFFAIFSLIFLAFSLNHFIVSFSSAFLAAITGLLISGLGIGLFAPNITGWLDSVAPAELRGKAVGGMTSALFLGQFFSPIITQPFINRLGLSATFAVAGAAALLIAIFFAAGAAMQHKGTVPAIKNTVESAD